MFISSLAKTRTKPPLGPKPASQSVSHPSIYPPPTVRKGDDDGDCDNDIKMKPSHWTGGYFGERDRDAEIPQVIKMQIHTIWPARQAASQVSQQTGQARQQRARRQRYYLNIIIPYYKGREREKPRDSKTANPSTIYPPADLLAWTELGRRARNK